MVVISKKYPNVELRLDDNTWIKFRNGRAEMDEATALKITQMSPDYEVDRSASKELVGGDYIPFDPATWLDQRKVIWDGPIGFHNGYGGASMMYIEALDKLVNLYVVNSKWQGTVLDHISPNLKRILDKKTEKVDSYYIKFFPAFEFTRKYAERYIGYTMLEASRIPQSWVDNCNKYCERVIVPCTHQKEAFVMSGVKRDVEIIPLGIIPELYPVVKKKPEDNDGLYYFGTMGTLTYRKGTDILIKAFMQGLDKKHYPDARLFIKTMPLNGIGNMWFVKKEDYEKDGRIDLCQEVFSPDELISQFFAKIDCFVFPTRGEGWGLPPMQSMACGIPTICTTYSGTGDFINDKVAYPLDYRLVDVPNGTFGGYPKELQAKGQQWAEPNFDQLIEYMRYCYSNRDKAKEIGAKAALYIREKYDIFKVAKQLVKYLEKKF